MRGRLNPTTRVVRAQGSTTQTRTSTPRSRIRTTHPRQLPREPRTWPQSDTNTALCLPLPGVLPLAAPATPRRRFAFFVRLADCARGRNPASGRARTARQHRGGLGLGHRHPRAIARRRAFCLRFVFPSSRANRARGPNPTIPAWAGTRTARQLRRHDTRVPTTRALRGATPADARQWR